MSDDSIYEVQVRTLEKELAAAKKTLRDQFAMAALTGMVAHYGALADSQAVFHIADAMLEARKS